MADSPEPYRKLRARYPELAAAFDALGNAAYEAGPLDPETCRLVKLALAIGCGLEGAVHSHVRRALEAGIAPEKLQQTALLAVTTCGFPAAMRAYQWVEDVLSPAPPTPASRG